MQSIFTSCNKGVGTGMTCPYCKGKAIKHGKTKQQKPRYRCRNENCRKTFLLSYSNRAYLPHINHDITELLKEGCGIRSTGRLLAISNTTIIKRILTIANRIYKPAIALHKSYEVDEMRTFCKSKREPLWIVYAIDKNTGKAADFAVGNRTKATLNKITGTLLLSGVTAIYTDKLPLYGHLIPKTLTILRVMEPTALNG